MVLTEEQQERIRKSRERALEIQKRRRREEQQHLQAQEQVQEENGTSIQKKRSGGDHSKEEEEEKEKRAKLDVETNKETDKVAQVEEEDVDSDLEAFEEGASDFVTKQEAKKMYCLPDGTLQCCKVVAEKDNPHHRGFAKMKLYSRKEIRRRARKRYGGKEGLIAERRKREDERFKNDIEKTKNIFGK